MGNTSPLGNLAAADPTAPAKNEDGSWNEMASWSGSSSNPHLLFDSNQEYYLNKNMRSMSNFDINIQFCKWLSLSNTFGYDYISSKQDVWWSPASLNGESLGGLSAVYQPSALGSAPAGRLFRYSQAVRNHSWSLPVWFSTRSVMTWMSRA